MSNQYEHCGFCGQLVQVSATADTDFGHKNLGKKLICYDCCEKIRGND